MTQMNCKSHETFFFFNIENSNNESKQQYKPIPLSKANHRIIFCKFVETPTKNLIRIHDFFLCSLSLYLSLSLLRTNFFQQYFLIYLFKIQSIYNFCIIYILDLTYFFLCTDPPSISKNTH